MADLSYIAASLTWALYGLIMGFSAGSAARLLWINLPRK
jgi:hypothetical protein